MVVGSSGQMESYEQNKKQLSSHCSLGIKLSRKLFYYHIIFHFKTKKKIPFIHLNKIKLPGKIKIQSQILFKRKVGKKTIFLLIEFAYELKEMILSR
jgi:hypothetical protein